MTMTIGLLSNASNSFLTKVVPKSERQVLWHKLVFDYRLVVTDFSQLIPTVPQLR
jgi:hypothetical protein